jgi:hypothetical protein
MMSLVRNNRWLRRALFVLVNLTFCAVVVGSTVMPISALFADRESSIVEGRKTLARLTAIAAQEAHVKSIDADTGLQMQRGEFLTGPNENVINADLQTRLKTIVETAGARSRAMQSLPPKSSGQIRYSGSRIEIYGPLQSIHRAVHTVEDARPYLFIAGAVLKMLPSSGRLDVPEEPVIQAQLDIFGAMQINGRDP